MIVRFREMSDGRDPCFCTDLECGCQWGWRHGAVAFGPVRTVEVVEQQPSESFEQFQDQVRAAAKRAATASA
jgi:hypothetical protein